MTTTSPYSTKRRFGFPSLESLGFFEAPFESSTSAPTTRVSTTRVETVVGKHTKRGVEGLWENTTFDAPSLVDWNPGQVENSLPRRRIRVTSIFLISLLVAGVSYLGYQLYQQPLREAESARVEVASGATTLSAELAEAHVLADQLADGSIQSDYILGLGKVDDAARGLFGAAATVASDDDSMQLVASDAATAALADSQRIRNGASYRLTLEPALLMPGFATDPSLIEIPDAALAFGDWRASLDEVATMLPPTLGLDLDDRFATFRATLPAKQSAYIDALQADDKVGAQRVLAHVESDLVALRDELATTFETLGREIKSSIDTTIAQLDDLVG